ncbi:peptidoglycan-binding domain-containing protein [Streptomyces sp. NPDC001153]
MSDSEGRSCPECGAPRGPDLSPSCDCTERAAEALRETRTAEAAAAEDFDPLRIRPYVKVEPAETTLPLRAVSELEGKRPEGARGRALICGSAAMGVPPGSSAAENLGERPATAALQPNDDPSQSQHEPPWPNRRGTTVLLCAAAAGTALAAAGFASGLFAYHAPSRDRAAQEVRQSVPEVSTPVPASPPAPSSPAPSHRPVPPPTASAGPPSPPATPSTSPPPSRSPSPSPPAVPSSPASTTASAAPRTTPAVAPVLHLGDQGPEVTELQQRLRQLNLYGDQIDGDFTRPVEDAVRTYQLARGVRGDTLGVYGPATRKSLEAETREP